MVIRKKKPSLGIALSGGLAFSVGHIGVLKAVEEAGLEISYVAGASGGAVVGACYAAGVPLDEMADAASGVRWRRIAALHMPQLGFFSSENIATFVTSQTGEITFDELRIPFRAVVADLMTGEEIEADWSTSYRLTLSNGWAPISLSGATSLIGGVRRALRGTYSRSYCSRSLLLEKRERSVTVSWRTS